MVVKGLSSFPTEPELGVEAGAAKRFAAPANSKPGYPDALFNRVCLYPFSQLSRVSTQTTRECPAGLDTLS